MSAFLNFKGLLKITLKGKLKLCKAFENHLNQCGILHMLTLLLNFNVDLQKGRDRHLVEMGLTLLFQANLSLKLWV